MSNIKDIHINFIKELLKDNNIPINKNDDINYQTAYNILMDYPNAIINSSYIVEWKHANALNQLGAAADIDLYTTTDINNMTEKQFRELSNKLQLGRFDVIHIINVLIYLHKLK